MGIPPWNGPKSRGPALIETQSAVEHDLHVAEVVQPRAVVWGWIVRQGVLVAWN